MWLKEILSWVRPNGSKGEENFVAWLEAEIRKLGFQPFFDGYGNLWVEHEDSRVLFTAHTDTVHSSKLDTEKQDVVFDDETGMAYLNPELGHGYVLGADDGTGCYILLRMLQAKVPASYVFFRAEEVGGIGSDWAVANTPDMFSNYDYAIAFDRKDEADVITYQGCTRCCSDDFAQALSDELNLTDGFKFKPCDGGVFTDTANLTHLIPECTNLSVGYYDQHSNREFQDLTFLEQFVQRLIQVNWSKLPVVRDPAKVETLYEDYYGSWGYMPKLVSKSKHGSSEFDYNDYLEQLKQDILHYGADVVYELVYNDPEAAAELLLDAYA